jgi:pyruvate ferredoxin oxidoreductase alpha subunit
MLKQIEGSQSLAMAVGLCRPQVICAYPITPQTHIVEKLGAMVKEEEIKDCEYINVESEFAAMSVSIGSSAAGVRTYTATSSQGLLFMNEAIYNASGLELPIVMTLGNRAIGAPINIWNDHSDAMTVRDSGWLMLFAEDNQEAIDLHIQAFKIAETLSIPTMVCVDGFVLTHAVERVDVPTQEQVDRFLPAYKPMYEFDTKKPVSIGAMVGPEAFTELRYVQHRKFIDAMDVIEKTSAEFKGIFGRVAGGLIRTYKTEDAETIVVAMGSVIGTLKDVIDERRKQGEKIGILSICSFRPFPEQQIAEALKGAKHIIVLDKSLALGEGSVLAAHIQNAVKHATPVTTLIAGLGGRPIYQKSLNSFFDAMQTAAAGELHFLDLKQDVAKREVANVVNFRAERAKSLKARG